MSKSIQEIPCLFWIGGFHVDQCLFVKCISATYFIDIPPFTFSLEMVFIFYSYCCYYLTGQL